MCCEPFGVFSVVHFSAVSTVFVSVEAWCVDSWTLTAQRLEQPFQVTRVLIDSSAFYLFTFEPLRTASCSHPDQQSCIQQSLRKPSGPRSPALLAFLVRMQSYHATLSRNNLISPCKLSSRACSPALSVAYAKALLPKCVEEEPLHRETESTSPRASQSHLNRMELASYGVCNSALIGYSPYKCYSVCTVLFQF
jgi:hypothetical protein